MSRKTLVAFFSASGQTRRLAKTIASASGADLFEIEPEAPYTAADLDWTNKKSRSTIEMKDPSSRPAIRNKVKGMDGYDVVFVGFPIWWGVAPTIVDGFLEAYDFSGKKVIPFATSGGSGMGRTESVLKRCCSDSTTWLSGRLLRSSESESSVRSWIGKLGL